MGRQQILRVKTKDPILQGGAGLDQAELRDEY